MGGTRTGRVARVTKETSINLALDLDGGDISIATDVTFLNHMLEAFAKHAGCGLTIAAHGDGLDHHHVVEDVGIALGRAIHQSLGNKVGIARFGSMMVPLDDALIAAAVDLSGRSYLNLAVTYPVEDLGDLKTELIREFFRAIADNGRMNVHLVQMNGTNAHHLCEATFKAFARAFGQAKMLTGDGAIASTKGMLE